MPVQISVYKPNHYSPHHKILYKLHGGISAQTHQLPLEDHKQNLAEK